MSRNYAKRVFTAFLSMAQLFVGGLPTRALLTDRQDSSIPLKRHAETICRPLPTLNIR
jgi:hypothetical protein